MSLDTFVSDLPNLLSEIDNSYYRDALNYSHALTRDDIRNVTDFRSYFESEHKPGFVKAKWSEDAESERAIKKFGVTVRCLPLQQSGEPGVCVLTGKIAKLDAVFARSY